MGFVPDPWQADVIRGVLLDRNPRTALLCSRQSGKTQTSAAIALLEAMGTDHTVLLLAPALRQSQEAFARARKLYRRLEDRVETTSESALRMEFASGGRLIALPGGEPDSVRGYSVDLLVVDEAARVSNDLYVATRPMIAATGGLIIAATTPSYPAGWFFDAWEGREDWERVRVPWTECPRLGPSVIDAEREALGSAFDQEYNCEWAGAGATSFISAETWRAAMVPGESIDRYFETDGGWD
jgi:hypothetical protein